MTTSYSREDFRDFVNNDLSEGSSGFPWGPVIGIGGPAALFAAGSLKTSRGTSFFNEYFKNLKRIEEGSPMGILSTFHSSELISSFAGPKTFSLLPPLIKGHPNILKEWGFQSYISKITGRSISELTSLGTFEKGLEWERIGDVFGELRVSGEGPLLSSETVLLSTGRKRSGHIIEWFARIMGVENPEFLKSLKENDGFIRPSWLPAGHPAGKSAFWKQFSHSEASSLIGRMNLLLQSPFDLKIMEDIASKVPFLRRVRLGVKSGTAAQMLGRYSLKGAAALGMYHVAKYGDYLSREYGPAGSVPFEAGEGAIFGAVLGLGKGRSARYAVIGAVGGALLGAFSPFIRGPIAGAAETYADLRVGQAGISKSTGLQEGAQRVEDYFPGLTKPGTLVAGAGVGLLLGGTWDYAQRSWVAGEIVGKKLTGSAFSTFELADEVIRMRREGFFKAAETEANSGGVKGFMSLMKMKYWGEIEQVAGKSIFKARGAGRTAAIGALVVAGLGFVGSLISGDWGGSALTGGSIAAAAGLYAKKGKGGVGAAAVALIIPYFLREKEDPEKLKRIYSGKELVPVKAGRGWEAGRCLTSETLIRMGDETYKKSCDIKVGDLVFGSDGKSHRIINVWERDYNGPVLDFITGLNRERKTSVTPNHIIPIWSFDCVKEDGFLIEVNSEEIKVGDFVKTFARELVDNWDKNSLYTRIISIEEREYTGKVYDFEIDSKDHLFQAGTFLVHNSSYEGGRPYYHQHRVAQMIQGGVRETAEYGSESAYWNSDPVLNPFRFLLDPYERERLMYEQGYKFPVTKTPFEGFPVLGPVLAATIGRILKPPRFVEKDQWKSPRGERTPEGWISVASEKPIMRTGIQGTIGEQFYNLAEVIGLPGFVANSWLKSVTGHESLFPKDQWATPSMVSGPESSWWSLDLGGLALSSESIRRYIPHRRSEVNYVNPLPSGLPSWMPGKDSGYFQDFSQASIYHQVKEPWARLPGVGYEKLHAELKGIDPENYPLIYQHKILGDVAPWSQEYRNIDRELAQEEANNRMTPEDLLEAQRTRKMVNEIKKNKSFTPYQYNPEFTQRVKTRITSEVSPGVYRTEAFKDAQVILAGLDTSPSALAIEIMNANSKITSSNALNAGIRKQAQVSDFLRGNLYPGAEVDLYVHRDPSLLLERNLESNAPQIEAIISAGGRNINRELLQAGLASNISTDVDILQPTEAVGLLQRAFGKFWENVAHGSETPMESFIPLAPVAKFIHQRDPLEEYQRTEVYSRDVALWQHPISHFLAPGISTTAWWAGWRGLPSSVRERYMVQEYFDRLKYMKYKNLERVSSVRGEGEAAAEYMGKASRTRAGAEKYSAASAAFSLSSKEKAYFEAFKKAPSESQRREIEGIVSPQLADLLRAQWLRQAAESAQMMGEVGMSIPRSLQGQTATYNRELAHYEGKTLEEINMKEMEGLPIPGNDWVGYSPAADLEDYEVKTVMDRGMDPAGYGFWPSDIKRANSRPWTSPLSIEMSSRGIASIYDFGMSFNAHTSRIGHMPPHILPTANSGGYVRVEAPGYDRLNRSLHDPTILDYGSHYSVL